MDFKNFDSKQIHGGIQYINFYPNGYGVSIVQHEFSFTIPDTWEVAILKKLDKDSDKWEICYTTDLTSNCGWGVLENLSDDQVNDVCKQVSELEEDNNEDIIEDDQSRTIKQTVNKLVEVEDYQYQLVRQTVSDVFIDFLREMLPDDYQLIADREEQYQNFKRIISEIKE